MRGVADILIVEDEPDLREIYRLLLERQGYQVRCAHNALEGLSQLGKCLPDLIVSDLRMPGMSGHKFLGIVRRCFPTVPVIVISGEFAGPVLPKRVLADAFFPRAAFTAQQLFERITLLLNGSLERSSSRPRA